MRGPVSGGARWRRPGLGGLALFVLLASLGVAGCGCGDESSTENGAASPATQQAAAQEQTQEPGVANPLPVGQAVDSVAAPAIAEVLGKPVLTSASQAEALIVSLMYRAPVEATEGAGESLLEAFLGNGADPDPEHPGVDSHGEAEEFMVLYDTGDPAFQTVRVTVTPGSPDVYVNADKAE